MSRTRKRPALSANQRQILDVLRASDKPLRHHQLVLRLTPWYPDEKSFKASVSSCLGVLRRAGYIACHERQLDNNFDTRGRSYPIVLRDWYAVKVSSRTIVDRALHREGLSFKVPRSGDMVKMLDDISRASEQPSF